MDKQINEMGEGYIVVRVSTARGAIPISDAEVVIRNSLGEESDIIASMLSSNSGLTNRISLAAPPRALSENPINKKPFATYNIEVRADGYITQYYNDVAVFDGITSYQNAILIPVSDNVNTDNFAYESSITVETPDYNALN